MNGYNIIAKLYYTPHQERFWSLIEKSKIQSDGIIFVFDISEKSSFESFKNRIKRTKDIKNDLECIIIANKCDLQEERQFSEEELKQLEKEFNMKVFETSAKTGEGVNEAFEAVIKIILNKKMKLK